MPTFHFLLECRSSHFQNRYQKHLLTEKYFMNVFILYSLQNILHITQLYITVHICVSRKRMRIEIEFQRNLIGPGLSNAGHLRSHLCQYF